MTIYYEVFDILNLTVHNQVLISSIDSWQKDVAENMRIELHCLLTKIKWSKRHLFAFRFGFWSSQKHSNRWI